jgi:hypothetical protein
VPRDAPPAAKPSGKHTVDTSEARQELTTLNLRIGVAESEGNAAARAWLAEILAPTFAFRRASGRFDGRCEFLLLVAPSETRDTTIEAIAVYGDRAVVRCVVAVKSPAGEKRFHNLRMFVRHDGKWKLLGWANEAL